MQNPVWRIEAHLWFENFDEYCRREKGLLALLEGNEGEGSVVAFLKGTPEYIELPGYSYDYEDVKQIDDLIDFCGIDNIDFIARVSRNADREVGCLRGKTKKRN